MKTTASTRVISLIQQDITAGRLKAGDRLPTRRELCEKYGIAPMTAARVVRVLSDEGWVVSDVGRGVFVAGIPTAAPDVPSEGSDQTETGRRLGELEQRLHALESRVLQLERPATGGG